MFSVEFLESPPVLTRETMPFVDMTTALGLATDPDLERPGRERVEETPWHSLQSLHGQTLGSELAAATSARGKARLEDRQLAAHTLMHRVTA